MKKRGVLGNKKAASVLLIEAMQLLAVALMLISAISFVEAKLGSVGFYNSFYSRDFGIMLTAMYGIPGNAYQIYRFAPKGEEGKSPLGFQLDVSNNFVKINASESSFQKIYWYYSNSNTDLLPFNENLGTRENILLKKEGSNMKIATHSPMTDTVLTCPTIDTKEPNWLKNKIIFDPGHNDNASDKGYLNSDGSLVESDIMLRLASNSAFSKLGNIKLTREGNYKTLAERQNFISQNANASSIIISFHAGSSNDQLTYVKAYYNAFSSDTIREKSRKLGCLIINSIALSKKLIEKQIDDEVFFFKKIEGIAVIPSDSDYIQKIIPKENVGVLLEIGNINRISEQNILAPIDPIADAVYSGIVKYHEN